MEQDESLVLDLPTSLGRLTMKEKPLYLKMISPSQDYHHTIRRTSDDVLRQYISHHLLEVNTRVRTLMGKAPSNDEKVKLLEKEMAALRKENRALKSQIASVKTWDQKIIQMEKDVNAAERNLKEITEGFHKNEQEVKEQSRREGIESGIKLCQEWIFAMEAGQQFLISLSKEWHDTYHLSTLSLMEFNSYMKFYFHGGFDAGCIQYEATDGKDPFDRTQAMVALGAPKNFQGDPKAKPDPHF